jgi:hypothetical protein
MAEVRALPTPEQRHNESAVEMLKSALAEAKRGEITGVVLIVFAPDRTFCVRSSDMGESLIKIGALEVAKRDIIAAMG